LIGAERENGNEAYGFFVFAGPNGSGKSAITSMMIPVGEHINAGKGKRPF